MIRKIKTRKLWQKVSMISIAIMILVVVVCSALLLNHAKNNILDVTIEQVRIQQRGLAASFSEMAGYYLAGETDPIVKESGIKSCFTRFADETAILTYENKTLYSAVSFAFEEVLLWDATSNYGRLSGKSTYGYAWYPNSIYREATIKGRHVLIVGSLVYALNEEYGVFIVKDITEIYNDIAAMTWNFIIICASSIVVGAVLISILIRRAAKPLIMLKDMTRRIAGGEYSGRVDVLYKNDEVGELAANFNQMTRAVQNNISKLEDMIQRQQLFVGGLTHELKTPVTSMMLHTDTLLTADLSAEESKISLKHLYEQCRWLERLSQKLLKLITLDEDIDFHPVKMRDLFEDVYASMAEILQERNTPLVMEYNADVLEIDYDLMKTLLINLIDNASKASGDGQKIRLRIYSTDSKYCGDQRSTIEISDNGSGIPKEEIPRVTDVFYMVDRSRSKKAGGSGLGLALVKMIADAHKAGLVIESELDAGTTVKINFPWKKQVIKG